MKKYRERDYVCGETMRTLRAKIGLTQAGLSKHLSVSRAAVGQWEAGSVYPKSEHLKKLIVLAMENQAFAIGHETEEIRALWKAAHQKVLLDEHWLSALLEQEQQERPQDPLQQQTTENPIDLFAVIRKTQMQEWYEFLEEAIA